MQTQGLAGEIFQHPAGADGLADPLGQGLALLAGQQAAQVFATLHDQGPGPVEDVGAHLGHPGHQIARV